MDKNFDKLAKKLAKNIYGTSKGKIRSAVLMRDLYQHLELETGEPLRILDAGGGFGHLSRQLAKLGHKVVLCDISSQMLILAQQQIEQAAELLDIELVHSSIQDLRVEQYGQFDLILCHAVAEWLADAELTIKGLLKLLKPDGTLSLMFYNKEAQRFHNLVSGNFDYVKTGLKVKKTVGLTPDYPLYIDEVNAWFEKWNLKKICTSGVRVINDYMKSHSVQQIDFDKLMQMELTYSQKQPYISIGRYVHFIGKFA